MSYSLFGKGITKNDVGYITDFINKIKSGIPVGKAWGETMVNASAAGKRMAVSVKQGKVELGDLNSMVKTSTASTIAATAATMAFNIALSFGISLAIQGIITLFDNLIHAEEKQIEKLNSLKSEIKENDDKIASMNDELKSTGDRIDELNGKSKLSFTEKNELERLKKQNAELQRSIDLLEHENEIKKKAAREQFVEIASSKLVKSGEAPYYSTLFGKNGTRIAQDVASRTGQNGMVASNLEMYEYYQAQLKQIDSQFKKNIKGKKKGSDEYDKIFEDYKKQREEVESDLTATSNEIVSFISELQDISSDIERVENPKTDTDKAVNAYLDFIENYRDKFAIISGVENAKENAFNRLVNSSSYSDTTQSLKKLGEQGEVTATMLSDPKYADFIQNLVDIGVVANSSEKSLAKIANAFNGVSMEFDVAGSVEKMKTAFKKSINYSEFTKEAEESFAEIDKDIKKEIENRKLSEATFGNVDVSDRQAIKWNDETLKKYKKALKSWNYTSKEIKKLNGSVSTMMGEEREFQFEETYVPISFTPVLQTDNGAELLDDATVSRYIFSLLGKIESDPNLTIDDLITLDATGLEIDGKKIKGLIADVGDTAKDTTKDLQTAEKSLNGLLKKKYGNIDANNWHSIEWNEEALKKNKEAIKSLGLSPDALKGTVSSTLPTTREYRVKSGNKLVDIPVAFTPILQTKSGATLLDQKTVDKYISGLFDKLKDNPSWTTEDLLALDAEGLEINYRKIHGLIADAGDTAEETSKKLGQLGSLSKPKYGNIEADYTKAIEWNEETIKSNRKALESWGYTADEIEKLNGSISTTLGTVAEYEDIPISFSPILQTDNGAMLLDADTVDKYIFSLLDELSDKPSWSVQDLLELDARGLEIEGKKISNLIAGIGDAPEFKEFEKWLDSLSAKDKEYVYEVYCETGDALSSLEEWQAAFNKHKLMIENSSSKIIAAFDSASQAATGFADSLKDIKSGTESFESYADAYKDAMELISKGADLDNGKLLAYAEYILGKDRVAELGYNVKKVKKALETVRVMYGDAEDLGAGMVARLSQVVDKSGKLLDENGETIATYNKKTGKWWVSNSHLEDVAKVLGTTKDGLAASIQALATHSNVVLENINEIKLRAEAVGATMSEKFNGKDVINSVTLEAKLREDGYTDKQVYDVLALLKKDKNTILIDLTTSSSSKDIIDVLSKLELVGKDSEGVSYVNLNEMVNALKESGATIPQIIDYITKLNDEGEIQIKVDGITETDLGKLKSSVENYYNHGVSSFEQANAKLKNLGLIDFDMNFDMSEEGHVGKIEAWIKNLQESLNKLRNEDGTINFQAEGATELVAIMTELISQKQVLNEPAIMKIKTDEIDDAGLKSAIEQIQNYQRLMNDFELETTLGIDTTKTQEKLRSAASEMRESIPDEILTTLGIDKSEWDGTLEKISNSTIDVKANVGVSQDDLTLIGEIFKGVSDIDEFTIGEKKIKITISNKNDLKAELDEINNYTFKKKTIKIGYEQTPFGGFRATTPDGGGGNADGTAHARGSWATKKSETALVGEAGREIISDVKTGKWYTVGDNGAEFRHIPKGSIVFNHKQTEELLRDGHINGRGTAFVNGTAYSEGVMSTNDIAAMIKKAQEAQKKAAKAAAKSAKKKTAKAAAKSSKKKTTKKSTKKSSSKKSSSKKSSSSSSSKDSDFVDWIEVKISRVERAIKNLETKVKSTFQALTTRLKATDNEIPKLNKEIEIQQKGADRYMKQADSVKLSSDLKKKVREGTVDIKKYDENTQKLITSYKQWYEKSLACSDAVLTLKESLAELYKTRFSMVQKDYENRLSIIAHDAATLNNKIANIEEHGYLVDESHYEKLRTDAEKRLSLQKKERDELTKYLSEAVRSGYIKEGSEAWYELTGAINSASEAIQDSETEVVKYTNTIREVGWKHFDYILSQVTAITDEAGFMMELLEKSDSFIKEGTGAGQLTNTGKAILGLHGQTYNVYMSQADKYADEIKKINKEIAKDPNNTKLLDRREELLKKQRESILSAEGEKSAIRDMVEEGINYELDALKDLADKYTDALDNAKDLYDYQKKVKDQTSEIAKLEKQMLAYSNDSSEESKAVKQRLQVELTEARENLKDTQYEQSISEQKKLIDNLYNEYETVLNKRLDDVDALIAEEIAYANDNASAICQTIKAESESVGYIISQEIAKIWSARNNPTLAVYDSSFSKAQTSTNQTINGVTSSLKKYARGGLVDYTGLAHVDGSPSNPEMVLSPSDTANFIALKDAMKKVSDGDGLLAKLFGQSNTLAQLAKVGAIPDSSGTKIGNISYEINIPIERVLDYNDFVNQLVADGKFESFLHAATTDRLVGGSKLAKNKYRW